MNLRPLGSSGLRVAPVILGGNVFGWTADESTSFAILDAAHDAGLTAIIGRWLRARPGRRAQTVIITKVGSDMGTDATGLPAKGLSARWIEQAVEGSLRRLGVDTIDHYFSHWPDDTPHEETLGAYDRLIRAGKVRSIGASNFSAAQLQAALAVAARDGLPRYSSLQPEYNLINRAALEGPLLDLCRAEGLGVIPYFGLASGFLTGLYRRPEDVASKTRKARLEACMTPRGLTILDALAVVAARHGATSAQVALAWVAAQPGLTAPIASATSVAQVADLAAAAALVLSAQDLADLAVASA